MCVVCCVHVFKRRRRRRLVADWLQGPVCPTFIDAAVLAEDVRVCVCACVYEAHNEHG